MSKSSKLKQAAQIIKSVVTVDSVVTMVQETLRDIDSGNTVGDNTKLTALHTLGDYKKNPQLNRDVDFVGGMIGGVCGTYIRHAVITVGLDLDAVSRSEFVALARLTDAIETQALKRLLAVKQ